MAINETTTMRAAQLVDEGEPENALVVQETPRPEPAADEVLVRVSHAALNHLDIWVRMGLPSVPKPRILGGDAVGTIEMVGGDVAARTLAIRELELGSRVVLDPGAGCGACRACASGESSLCARFRVLGEHVNGTHAQFVAVPAVCVHAAPAHLDDPAAASLMLAHSTAWRMLFTRARAKAHERVLVWGASSGVGAAALQLCSAAGIETIATTRESSKADALRTMGADHVIVTADASDPGGEVTETVAQITAGAGVDVAFDHLGAVAWTPSMRALRPGGRYVTCGATTGATPSADITRLFWKQLSMLGSTMASRSDVEQLLAFVNRHQIAPRVDRVFELDEVAAAHRHLESAGHVGKVVLRVSRSRG